MRPSSIPGDNPQELLELIFRTSRECPAAVLLRHSAREEIKDARSAIEALLTPEGKAAARAFGSGLPADRSVRIFHSPVERCRETALQIAGGLRERGGRAGIVQESDILGGPYVLDPEALLEMLVCTNPFTFMEAWSGGRISERILKPLEESAVRTLQFVLSSLEEAGKEALDLHVTHDINIMMALGLAKDISVDWSGWPGYLEGPVLLGDGGRVTILFRGRSAAIERNALMPRRRH
jgi:broad specificity phosphatase PhoE